jgi:nucleoid DNA-binding protein
MRCLQLIGLAGAVLPLLLGGCSKKKSLTDPLEEMDLATVCAGVAEPRAKAYAKDGPNAHGIALFSRGAEEKEMEKVYPQLLAEFAPTKPVDVELVACVVRTAQTKAESCDYQEGYHLDTYDGTFEVSIREARTAAVVKTGTISLAAPPCWGFESFKEKTMQAYPGPELAVVEPARDLVQAHEGGAPVPIASFFGPESVSDSSLTKVCHGYPEKRAAAYAKAEGKVSPAAFFSRPNDRSPFSTHSTRDFDPWKVKDGKDYQLVVCITEKSRTKTNDCQLDGSHIIRSVSLYSSTYEVTVREAKTGKVVTTTTVNEEGEKTCPTFYPAITTQTSHVDEVPFGGPATVAVVKPLIAP